MAGLGASIMSKNYFSHPHAGKHLLFLLLNFLDDSHSDWGLESYRFDVHFLDGWDIEIFSVYLLDIYISFEKYVFS